MSEFKTFHLNLERYEQKTLSEHLKNFCYYIKVNSWWIGLIFAFIGLIL